MDQKSPTELAEEAFKMAMEYARLSKELMDLRPVYASMWLQLKAESKSDAEANRKWELTPEGIKQEQIKIEMKALEKMISATKGLQHAMENELNNASLN